MMAPYFAVLLLSLCYFSAWCFKTNGTPDGVPDSFDCAVRRFALSYGQMLLPQRGSFRSLFDALQLQNCGDKPPPDVDKWVPPRYPNPSADTAVFVDPSGSDANPGTIELPVQSLAQALLLSRQRRSVGLPTIVLRAGTYFLSDSLVVAPLDSGLTIQNYNGEHAVLLGGIPLSITKEAWTPFNLTVGWSDPPFANLNAVWGEAQLSKDSACCRYLGTFNTLAQCQQAVNSSASTKGPFTAYTWHSTAIGGDWAGQCFGRVDGTWVPVPQDNIFSGLNVSRNTWRANLTSSPALQSIPGLRVSGQRAVRAKYPDGSPEESAQMYSLDRTTYVRGWISSPSQWRAPAAAPPASEMIVDANDWPSVEWPMSNPGSDWTGMGDWGKHYMGLGGTCHNLEPPYGYYCSNKPPRGDQYVHVAPSGVGYDRILPNFPYRNASGAVLQAWRGDGRWYTWQFLVEGLDQKAKMLLFSDTVGGNQGGEGASVAAEWWIENVLEECDAPGEFYFDAEDSVLYYNFNGTSGTGPTGDEEWVATQVAVLFNISGDQKQPVKNVVIRGLEMRDTRYTYMDPHGLPSGGDWAIQRSGAVLVEGAEGFVLDGCYLHHLDGNGVFLTGYQRNSTISNNELAWIGDTAIASWGITGPCINENCSLSVPYPVGPDGRSGDQPRDCIVSGNLVREIGIWQKQSSMWFQAITAGTHLVGNVHFNGARAGINFNDGFGGGDVMERNLVLNCVRESSDHGPFNSWDRVPYITTVRTGKPSIIPADRTIRQNFILGTYYSQEAIDNDDGSSYYSNYDNFYVYADNGLKSDFGGHDNKHYLNIYAYLSNCFGNGRADQFRNNTCIIRTRGDAKGYNSDCNLPQDMQVYGNSVYNEDSKINACGTTLQKWIQDGHDPGTTLNTWPSDDQVIEWARKILNFPNK